MLYLLAYPALALVIALAWLLAPLAGVCWAVQRLTRREN